MDEILENVQRVALFSQGKAVKVCTPYELFKDNTLDSVKRLGLPVTCYLENKLNEIGVQIDSNLKIDDFIKAVTKKYKEK
jgi:hypothetical protein